MQTEYNWENNSENDSIEEIDKLTEEMDIYTYDLCLAPTDNIFEYAFDQYPNLKPLYNVMSQSRSGKAIKDDYLTYRSVHSKEAVFNPTGTYSALYPRGNEPTPTLSEVSRVQVNVDWFRLPGGHSTTYAGAGYANGGKGNIKPACPDDDLSFSACGHCKSMEENEKNPIVFCDSCNRAWHVHCDHVNRQVLTKAKVPQDDEDFTCCICAGKAAVPDDAASSPYEGLNIGMPVEQQALAVRNRSLTDIMQVMSCYHSPYYPGCGNVFKWVGRDRNYSSNRDHPLYSTWTGIITRTMKSAHYTKNNIRLDRAWLGTYGLGPGRNRYDPFAWFSFLYYVDRYLGPRPFHGKPAGVEFTIDRINPFAHYEPGNIRWAWVGLQNDNKMHMKGSTTSRKMKGNQGKANKLKRASTL